MFYCFIFFFKQKTAYEMRISDWSSDVCSSDLPAAIACPSKRRTDRRACRIANATSRPHHRSRVQPPPYWRYRPCGRNRPSWACPRSEEHTSELQSLMRISYAVFCLKKKKTINHHDSIDLTTPHA